MRKSVRLLRVGSLGDRRPTSLPCASLPAEASARGVANGPTDQLWAHLGGQVSGGSSEGRFVRCKLMAFLFGRLDFSSSVGTCSGFHCLGRLLQIMGEHLSDRPAQRPGWRLRSAVEGARASISIDSLHCERVQASPQRPLSAAVPRRRAACGPRERSDGERTCEARVAALVQAGRPSFRDRPDATPNGRRIDAAPHTVGPTSAARLCVAGGSSLGTSTF